MPKLKLTDATLKALKPPPAGQVDYFDNLLPSFGVRVAFTGTKTFFVFDRVGGKLKRMTIGRYGPSPLFGLAEAREKARTFKASAERGADPVDEAKREAAAAEASTFGKAVESFLARQKSRLAASTLREYKNCLTGQDVADWKDRQIFSISKADVKGVLDKIDKRGKPSACNHALAHIRLFFNDCIDRDLMEHSPANRVKALHDNTKRDRALSADELAIVAAALRDDDATLCVMYGVNDVPPLSDTLRDYFLTLMLTGQRRAEVAGMTWDEVHDLTGKDPRWELSGNRTKNGLPHMVPLSPTVAAILQRRKALGDAERRKAEALAKRDGGEALAKLNSDAVFAGTLHNTNRAKVALDSRVTAVAKAMGRPALPHWTGHDLRRTMVTGMNEMGIAPHVVEAVVNHISGAAKAGVAGVYNRALYLPERRAALNAWAHHVAALEPTRAS
ncbi:site-specific integrase [Mesorhizobium sp. PAMC28654]|uniref:tyrosine-type recombinase/integrase n=1 Tax=Mesorhizobium sp. PAMC28654 TaxID=2880934 RepID=UPI001D0A7248|nr:site-specific integrase [Mesorhizobium sp. PAMC28654]UDL88110.1 site-specific integrase [Mesorhizobium sp. PAMC28654]